MEVLASNRFLKLLIFLMFASFAMTTDSVGTIIPEVIREFQLGMTSAGAFHYSSMAGIGLSAMMLGFMADRFGRKSTIIMGLTLFGVTSALFMAGNRYVVFVILLFVSGLGIGIFKAGALALIGDVSASTREHSTNMNLAEGFFGLGAILGPAIVAFLLQAGASWKWLYVAAALLCALLILGSFLAPFPRSLHTASDQADPRDALRMLADQSALLFATMLMLYVAAEASIYVWAPTFFAGYDGPNAWAAAFVVSIFFIFRAVGRFLGAWLLTLFNWASVLAFCSIVMAMLFWSAVVGGKSIAVFALPMTGIFMSVLYPTINSTGISCFEKSRHGSIAGFLLFFTCVGAVLAPLSMGAVGDLMGNADYTMALGAVFATGLAMLCLWNFWRRPVDRRLADRNAQDYSAEALAEGAARSLS